MASKQQEFLALFRAYVQPGGAEKALFDFIDGLDADDLSACTQAYFDEDKYQAHRGKSLAVFVKLAVRTASLSPFSALHVEAMTELRGSPWQTRFAELKGDEREKIKGQIKRRKHGLTGNQRQFAEKFRGYMAKPRKVSQQEIEKFTGKIAKGDDLQGCVRVYIELSQAYEDGNGKDSLLIFFGVSMVALQKSGFDYAFTFEANTKVADSTWKLRYDSLADVHNFQQKLKEQISDRKVIREDVAIDDPRHQRTNLHKDVPIGKAQMDATPTEKAHPEDRRDTPFSGVQKDFIRVYRQYVDSKGDKDHLQALHEFHRKHNGEELRLCVLAYLQDSEHHYAGQQTKESLLVFFSTLSVAVDKNNAYYALKVLLKIDTKNSIWNQRFEAVEQLRDYAGRLRTDLDLKVARGVRLIDEVKLAYFKRYDKEPNLQALRDFNTAAVPEQEQLLDSALGECEIAIASGAWNVDNFNKAFGKIVEVLRANKDRMTIVQLVKRCRDRRSLDGSYRSCVYLYAVSQLQVNVAPQYKHDNYLRGGLNEEEKRWLLDPGDMKNAYFTDLVEQLEYGLKTNKLGDYSDLARGVGALLIHADKMRLRLTPLIQAQVIRGVVTKAWEEKGREVSGIRIPVSHPRMGTKQIRIGQTVGKFYVLWWDRDSTVYVQVEGMDQVVFEASMARFAEICADDAFYGEVARNTEHLLVLIPLFFEILGYLPDLVSGGLVGLAKSIAFSMAFDKSMELLGIDPTKSQIALLGVSLLAHHMGPKHAPNEHIDAAAVDVSAVAHNPHASGTATRMVDSAAVDIAPSVTRGRGTGVNAPDVADARIGGGSTHAADGPKAAVDVGAQPPNLASREGIDMRGVDVGDGRIGVGIHERADPMPEVGGGKGAAADARANQRPDAGKAAPNISDTDRGLKTAPPDEHAGGAKADARKTGSKGSKEAYEGDRKSMSASDQGEGGVKGGGKGDAKDRKKKRSSSQDEAGDGSKGDEGGGKSDKKKGRGGGKGEPPPPPPPPPPPRAIPVSQVGDVRQRMDIGTWRVEDNVPINEGGMAITGNNRHNAMLYSNDYELAFNQQIAPQMAERLSNKEQLRMDPNFGPGQRTPSSSVTDRFKYQRNIAGGGINRRPEAVQEIKGTIGGKEGVVESNVFEATHDKNFSPGTSHKRKQLAGTDWILSGTPRKGYSADTVINYHIISPEAPSAATRATLNNMMRDRPNLQFFWYVIRNAP